MSLLPVGISGEAQYQISRSLRFNSADSAYLNRTQGTSTNQSIGTWSFWYKRATLGTSQRLFEGYTASNDTGAGGIEISSDDKLYVFGWSTNWRITTQVFRDPSAWYHFVIAVDTTQATANNRLKIYVNGSEITAFGTTNNPTQNATFGLNNNSSVLQIGRRRNVSSNDNFLNGYLTEINFIDGQALTPSSFGETNPTTGVWQPKKYTGTYGNNGFYLNFSDNASTTTLGDDFSGNGNNWTPNNFSVTAGADNDSLVDTPTPYGSDTGVGNEVRGNYCTWNPLGTQIATYTVSVTNGNLDASYNAATNVARINGTLGLSSGKWYFEFQATAGSPMIGVATTDGANAYVYDGNAANKRNYAPITSGSPTSAAYGATWNTTNIIGVALDLDAGTLVFYKDNVSQGTAYSSLSGTFTPTFGYQGGTTVSGTANFGQRPFAYTAPSGFKALCTQNLPEPVIKDGGDYFNTVLFTGTSGNVTVSGVGFQPDFVWAKARSNVQGHELLDAVRGGNKLLQSNTTGAELTLTSPLTFNSDGFVSTTDTHTNGYTYVAWNWKANGAGVTNTAGTITSTVSVNTTSGFSIVTYTGIAGNVAKTFGHGLGVAPNMVIIKPRTTASAFNAWVVWHSAFTGSEYIYLDLTNAKASSANYWGATVPSSTVVTVGGNSSNVSNESGINYVAYCFAPVAGYSAFGSYTGNGSSTDGPFVYTGFRPRYLLIKSAVVSGGSWVVFDSARSTYNVTGEKLAPNTSDSENSGATGIAGGVDFLSNGFKIRLSWGDINTSNTLIYAAFAENPFKYSLAR